MSGFGQHRSPKAAQTRQPQPLQPFRCYGEEVGKESGQVEGAGVGVEEASRHRIVDAWLEAAPERV